MMKIFRLLKIIRVARNNKKIKKILNVLTQGFKMTPAISRLISFIFAALILTHVFACLWFLTAKFAEFSPDTWVTRKGLQDETPGV